MRGMYCSVCGGKPENLVLIQVEDFGGPGVFCEKHVPKQSVEEVIQFLNHPPINPELLDALRKLAGVDGNE